MEVVVEHGDIDELLREALEARGVKVPPKSVMGVRRNNKKNTIRIAFTEPPKDKKP